MSIKKEMFHGVLWSAIEKYSGVIISIFISAILARLISPSDFGVIAIATVIINFLTIFTDMGIGPAIIQRRDLSEKNLDSIFTFTIIAGFFLSVLLYFAAEPIAHFYGNQSLSIICRILSINLFFSSLNIVPHASILKDKKFKKIAKRTLILQVSSGIVSVLVAYRGGGMYSLLISPISTSIGSFIYNLKLYPRRIDTGLDYNPLKKIYSFSLYQFLFSFMNYFSRNVDSLLIGRYFNLRELGFYDKSYRLMMLPLQNVTNVITPVMQPVLSSLENNKAELAKKYNEIIKLVGTISFPLSIFLYYSGSELIHIVYGGNWDPAIPVFKIFSLSLSFQMILSTSGAIYQSANSTKYMFFNGLINTISTVSAFVLATFIWRSITSMAWAWNISLSFNMICSYLILYKIVLHSSILDMIKPLVVPIVLSAVMALLFYIMNKYLFLKDIPSLGVKFLVAVVVCFTGIQMTKHYDLLRFVKARS